MPALERVMPRHVVLLSIPGLRRQDVSAMPRLRGLADGRGTIIPLVPSFPCVTCPVQANLTTGVGPDRHGVIANGFFYRDQGEVEMWTAWNECLQAPQIWELLQRHDPALTSAVWFPLHSKGAKADYICTPAPIHNPDGSESLWCYTKPTEMYGELRDALGHFPLMHFWGPLANIKSTDWIVNSAVFAAKKNRPRFSYIYLPHLDYAAQRTGPDSPSALAALGELDAAIGRLVDGYADAGIDDVLWLVAGEYAITPVSQVGYPNRALRQAGLLSLTESEGREQLDVGASRAWALVDHQFAHVFVRNAADVPRAAEALRADPAIERVLAGAERREWGLDHPRSGEIVAIARPEGWLAYYWWLDDARAPAYARTVDIHRKPGYDPVELHFDPATRSIPLNAALVKGSHGYPAALTERQSILLSSSAEAVGRESCRDVDVCGMVLRAFNIAAGS
jgi:predicted AlkP superfamily pyrophosphatase or phosphodiesterase